MVVVGGESRGPALAFTAERRAVLIIDVQLLCAHALGRLLTAQDPDLEIQVSRDMADAWERVKSGRFGCVICDVHQDQAATADLMRRATAAGLSARFILIGRTGDEAALFEGFNAGAAGAFRADAAVEDFLVGYLNVLAGHRSLDDRILSVAIARDAGRTPEAELLHRLSSSERAILTLVGQAVPVSSIAETRGITEKTVRNHMASIYTKLDLHNRAEAVLKARRLGLTGGDAF